MLSQGLIFLALGLMCKRVEKPLSHKEVAENGTRSYKTVFTNWEKVSSRVYQKVFNCLE